MSAVAAVGLVVLGIGIGIVLCFFALSITLPRKRNFSQLLDNLEEGMPLSLFESKESVEFLAPVSEQAEAIARVVSSNDMKGKDTKLEDIV